MFYEKYPMVSKNPRDEETDADLLSSLYKNWFKRTSGENQGALSYIVSCRSIAIMNVMGSSLETSQIFPQNLTWIKPDSATIGHHSYSSWLFIFQLQDMVNWTHDPLWQCYMPFSKHHMETRGCFPRIKWCTKSGSSISMHIYRREYEWLSLGASVSWTMIIPNTSQY